MSYRDVRGRWWDVRSGGDPRMAAPLLPRSRKRLSAGAVLRAGTGVVIAWALANALHWTFVMREPSLRMDPCRGLVAEANSQVLRTGEGRALQRGFNPYGSVRLPSPREPRQRVLLLGDSEMAGYALDPSHHMGQWLARRFPDAQIVCQAQPNYSVADYIRMARCDRGFARYDLVIIEGCELDVGAEAFDSGRGRGLAFARLEAGGVRIGTEPLGWVGRHLEFYNAYWRFDAVGRRLMPFARSVLRVLRNPRPAAAAATAAGSVADSAGMRPLLTALATSVRPPIVWLYVQRVHGIGAERAPDFDRLPAFASTCRELEMTFVDPGSVLADFRSADGNYANGGGATTPGTGHLNAEGHRLLYEAVEPAVAAHLASAGGR